MNMQTIPFSHSIIYFFKQQEKFEWLEAKRSIKVFGDNFFCPWVAHLQSTFSPTQLQADIPNSKKFLGERDGMTLKNLFPYRPVQTEVAWMVMPWLLNNEIKRQHSVYILVALFQP